MSMTAAPPSYTVEEFLALPDHRGYELVDGELVGLNVSNLAAFVSGQITTHLNIHCAVSKDGRVFSSEGFYQLFPDRPRHGRKPDISFIRKEHLPEGWQDDGYFTLAPDLVVEVISPGDLFYEVDKKIREYLEAGVKLIWSVNPHERLAYVHRADGTVSKLTESGRLDGEDVIPGFQCLLAEIFDTR